MVRDEELKRLIKYAEGLGLKVRFLSTEENEDAAWTLDGKEIHIYNNEEKAKIDLVLTVIHELGHHLWFIRQKERQPDLKFEEAIEVENLYLNKVRKDPPARHLRDKILSVEKAGTQYWESIYIDTNMKFPKWRLFEAMEFDIWQYEVYCEKSKFPNRQERRKKLKLLRNKYRPK